VARFSNGLALNFTPEAGAEGLYKTAYTIEEQGVYSIEVLFANASASVPIQGKFVLLSGPFAYAYSGLIPLSGVLCRLAVGELHNCTSRPRRSRVLRGG
jgi:hypothetical protein